MSHQLPPVAGLTARTNALARPSGLPLHGLALLVTLAVAAGPQGAALERDRAFDGTWVLTARHHGLERLASERRRIVVSNGVWREDPDGRRLIVTRSAGGPWPVIEVRFGPAQDPPPKGAIGGGGMGGGMRGIYRLEGDTLRLVFGPWRGPLPDGLEPAPGRDVEVWRRVRP